MSGNFCKGASLPSFQSGREQRWLCSRGGHHSRNPLCVRCSKAEIFAFGSVYLLDALKCSSICFGSESGSIDPFFHTVELLKEQEEKYNQKIRFYIKQGVSYPKALALAYAELEKIKIQLIYQGQIIFWVIITYLQPTN